MNKSTQHSLDGQTWLKGEYVIYGGIIWSTIALIVYLTFSVVEPNIHRPQWFIIVTTGLEEISLIVSGYLCLRNWKSRYIPSGRAVWLLLAIAMLTFFVGNLWFTLWELLWGLDPGASVGNICFSLFYLVLIAGMRLATLDRDTQLARQQWVIVLGVAAFGLTIGCWLTTLTARAGSIDSIAPIVSMAVISHLTPLQQPPDWILAIDRQMQPLVQTFNLFYVLCDLVLLILAAVLFLGFWGGPLGLPWRTTAQAVFCFYIADTWFAYANNQVQGYESGSIMEVFWIFGIVQFGIAAALEFDNSIRARRLARRRTAI